MRILRSGTSLPSVSPAALVGGAGFAGGTDGGTFSRFGAPFGAGFAGVWHSSATSTCGACATCLASGSGSRFARSGSPTTFAGSGRCSATATSCAASATSPAGVPSGIGATGSSAGAGRLPSAKEKMRLKNPGFASAIAGFRSGGAAQRRCIARRRGDQPVAVAADDAGFNNAIVLAAIEADDRCIARRGRNRRAPSARTLCCHALPRYGEQGSRLRRARRRSARSRTKARSSCGMRAAGVPGRGENGKTWTCARPHSSISDSDCANISSVSVGKPAIRSAPKARSGRRRRRSSQNRNRFGARMAPLHALQDQVVAMLQRQVEMRLKTRLARAITSSSVLSISTESIEDRRRRRKSGDLAQDRCDEIAELRRTRQVGAPGSGVDAGQHDFEVAVVGQAAVPVRRPRPSAPSATGRGHRG